MWALYVASGIMAGLALGLWLARRRPAPREPDDRDTWMNILGGGLAHELRTPLSTVQMNLQLLAEEWRQASTEREQRSARRIEAMQRSLDRMHRIMEAFVSFARAGRPAMSTVSLNSLVQDVVQNDLSEILASRNAQGRVQVHCQLGPDVPPVPGDPILLRQALSGLLTNAVEAVAGGGEVRVQTESNHERVRIHVSDTGPGVPPEIRDRIWNVFFTTKPSGTGMGLPVARRIVGLHGGSLDLRTNGGTTFTISLPLRRE